MAGNVIEEYLVGIGADIDTGSFNSAMMAISQLGKSINAIKGAAPIIAVAAAIVGVGKAAYNTIKDVPRRTWSTRSWRLKCGSQRILLRHFLQP